MVVAVALVIRNTEKRRSTWKKQEMKGPHGPPTTMSPSLEREEVGSRKRAKEKVGMGTREGSKDKGRTEGGQPPRILSLSFSLFHHVPPAPNSALLITHSLMLLPAGLGNSIPWVQIPALPVTERVNVGRFLNLSRPLCPHL